MVTLLARQRFPEIVRDIFSNAAELRSTSPSSGSRWRGPAGSRASGCRRSRFLAALPAAGIVAGRLGGRSAARFLPLALALAPLAIGLAAFGRMYSLYLAATLWATVAALWAAGRDNRSSWTTAGAIAGVLVYVHPAAPIVSALAIATGLLWSDASWRTLFRTAWPAPLALLLVHLPYYVYALDVLRDR